MQSESFTCQDHLTGASGRLCKEGSRKGRGGQREPFALLALFTPFLLLLAQDAFWHWACSDSTLPNARLLLRMVNKMLTRFLLYGFLGRGEEVFWTAVEETVSRGKRDWRLKGIRHYCGSLQLFQRGWGRPGFRASLLLGFWRDL